jgi:hypothetical protein
MPLHIPTTSPIPSVSGKALESGSHGRATS